MKILLIKKKNINQWENILYKSLLNYSYELFDKESDEISESNS